MRQEFSKHVRLAAFQRANGQCEKCTVKLYTGRIEYHHIKEATFDGEATLSNCLCICTACHSAITRKRAAVIAKSNRVRNREIGIKKPRTIRGWRKMNGDPVYADRER